VTAAAVTCQAMAMARCGGLLQRKRHIFIHHLLHQRSRRVPMEIYFPGIKIPRYDSSRCLCSISPSHSYAPLSSAEAGGAWPECQCCAKFRSTPLCRAVVCLPTLVTISRYRDILAYDIVIRFFLTIRALKCILFYVRDAIIAIATVTAPGRL